MNKNNLLGKESLAQKMEKLKQEMDINENDGDKEKQSKNTKLNKLKKIQNYAKNNPKLFISGRLDRKKHTYTAKSLILLTTLEDEIKTYCRGGELAILNYLIKEGLKNVKKSSTSINVEVEELEKSIT